MLEGERRRWRQFQHLRGHLPEGRTCLSLDLKSALIRNDKMFFCSVATSSIFLK